MLIRGEISQFVALHGQRAVKVVPIRTYPVEPFLDRIWELRENLTVYDAWYVALAEALAVAYATADRRIAAVPGLRCSVDVV